MKAKSDSIAVATTYFLLGTCDCAVNSNVGTGDFARVWTRARAIASVSGYGLQLYDNSTFWEDHLQRLIDAEVKHSMV